MSWLDAFDHNAQIQRYGTQSFFEREFYTEFEDISVHPEKVIRDGCVATLPVPLGYRDQFEGTKMIYAMCPLKIYHYSLDDEQNKHIVWVDWLQCYFSKWALNLIPVDHDDMNKKPVLSKMLFTDNVTEFYIPKNTDSWVDDLFEYLRPGYGTGIHESEEQLRKDYKRRLKMLEAIKRCGGDC